MPDELELARGWFLKADSDLNTAKHMVESDGPYDTACFHAQQAAEKYLQGPLSLRGEPFHRTHDLEELQHLGEALAA
ncbi:MAG: HEPN domain-containing protein [Terriglobia bacterium]|jgi:HEPN domain-containing protein